MFWNTARSAVCVLVFALLLPLAGHTGTSLHAPVKTGTITAPQLSEISGIFASRTRSSILWAVNDSGNSPELYAVTHNGQLVQSHRIEGAKNRDWEDLSGFRFRGEEYLLIADIGDNHAIRGACTLYAVKEPKIQTPAQALPVAWQMRFKYKDGPRDCEAIAVDETNQKILLLSKRTPCPVLYELPLPAHPKEDLYTAVAVAWVRTIPPPTPADIKQRYGRFRSWPTAMDITGDGRTLAILTYKDIYLYHRSTGQPWDKVFASPPQVIALPLPETGELIQREALCMDPASGRIIVTTEQLPAPIYTVAP